MYILRHGLEAEAFSTTEELHNALKPKIRGRSYLIQQGIDLLRHADRPFDLRVLTQKDRMEGGKQPECWAESPLRKRL